MRVGRALGPLPSVLAPTLVLEELSIMKSSMQRGRWGAGAGLLGKCPICVGEHECVVLQWALLSTSGWRSTHNFAGLGPSSPHSSLSHAFHSCSSGIPATWVNHKFQPSS